MQISIMRNKNILKFLSICFLILLWYIICFIANQSLLLPIPYFHEAVLALSRMFLTGSFWEAVFSTLLHIVGGFFLALVVGSIGGFLSGARQIIDSVTDPWVHLVRTIPVAAITILAWLWIPARMLPIFISALMVLPIIWGHVKTGTATLDPKLKEMGQSFGLSSKELFLKIEAPQLTPHIKAACITGFGIAWKSCIAAEIIASPTGTLGALLQGAKASLEYDEVFALLLWIILLSLSLEFLMKWMLKEKSK